MLSDDLRKNAATLPLSPGVYLMRDKDNKVIYVGKAKKLRNRVTQYFQDTVSHSPKTKLMVSNVSKFDVIVAASEFEALILECSMIKQYMPKYNILLKDDKGFPYVKLDMRVAYPKITMVNKISDDGSEYYGPFGSRGVTNNLLKTITEIFKIPDCSLKFPRDVGKGRPCLNYHMNRCAGWCQTAKSQEQYYQIMEQVRQLLRGNYRSVVDSLKIKMQAAADSLNFELAATLRDRINAIETLGRKQLVTSGSMIDRDVIGYAYTEMKACFSVLHFTDGKLLDKECEVVPLPDNHEAAVSSLLKQYYIQRGCAPRIVLLPFKIEDAPLFADFLAEKYNCRTKFIVPQRGDNAQLMQLACKNALDEADRVTQRDERIDASLVKVGKMLAIETPIRIESFDISNISGSDIVAGMTVFHGGRPCRSEYKRFKINGLSNQDDYASMREALSRRFQDYIDRKDGFCTLPNLLLIDGGVMHTQTAVEVIRRFGISIPVFGMVKDDRHRTRALVTADGKEIRIDTQQSVFALIGNIQEETHRFAIGYHKTLRHKRLRYSELDTITGIGPKRKQVLLKAFKSIKGIACAELFQLEQFLPKDAALAVYEHFKESRAEEGNICE